MDAEYIPETLLAKVEADINKDIERREKFRHTDSGDFDDSEPFVYTPKKFGPLAESKLDKYIKLLEKQTGKKVMLESNEEAFKKRLAAGIKQGGFDVTEILSLTDINEDSVVHALQNTLEQYFLRKGWGFEAQMSFIHDTIKDAEKDTSFQLNESHKCECGGSCCTDKKLNESRHRLSYTVITGRPAELQKQLEKFVQGIKFEKSEGSSTWINNKRVPMYIAKFEANEDLERIFSRPPFDKLILRSYTGDAALLGHERMDVENFKKEKYPSMNDIEEYFDFVEDPAIKAALQNPTSVSDLTIDDQWTDDHEQCFAVSVKINGVPVKMSLWWIDARWVYQMEAGKASALKGMIDYIKSYNLTNTSDFKK